jgi:hypothetical protein
VEGVDQVSVLYYTIVSVSKGAKEADLMRIVYDADVGHYTMQQGSTGVAITPAELEQWVDDMVAAERIPDPGPLYEYLDWLPER